MHCGIVLMQSPSMQALSMQSLSMQSHSMQALSMQSHSLQSMSMQSLGMQSLRMQYRASVLPALQVSGNQSNLLVAAATGQMMVYSSDRLVWAAKGDICPVAVKVAAFGGQAGLISISMIQLLSLPNIYWDLLQLASSITFVYPAAIC